MKLKTVILLLLPLLGVYGQIQNKSELHVLNLVNKSGSMDSTEMAALSDRFRTEWIKTDKWNVIDQSPIQDWLGMQTIQPSDMKSAKSLLSRCPLITDSTLIAIGEIQKFGNLFILTGYLNEGKKGILRKVDTEVATCPLEFLLSASTPNLVRSLNGLPRIVPVFEKGSNPFTNSDSSASIRVVTTPSDFRLMIDEWECGMTPITVDHLHPGMHLIRLSGEHFHDWIQYINLKSENRDSLNLKLVQTKGSTHVDSEIPNSMVQLDGNYAGYTPILIPNITAGRHEIAVSTRKGKTNKTLINVEEGKTTPVFAVQTRSWLTVTGDLPGVDIKLSGKSIGRIPVDTLAVLPDDYRLTVTHPGFERFHEEISIDPLQKKLVQIHMKPRTRSKAVFRSILFPGWGQLYLERPVRGIMAMTMELASIGLAVQADVKMGTLIKEYDRACAKYQQAIFLKYIQDARQEMTQKYNEIQDQKQFRDIMICSAAGIWLGSILDAWLYHPNETVKQFLHAGNLQFNPVLSPDFTGLQFNLTMNRP